VRLKHIISRWQWQVAKLRFFIKNYRFLLSFFLICRPCVSLGGKRASETYYFKVAVAGGNPGTLGVLGGLIYINPGFFRRTFFPPPLLMLWGGGATQYAPYFYPNPNPNPSERLAFSLAIHNLINHGQL